MLNRIITVYQELSHFVLYKMPVTVQILLAFLALTSVLFAPFFWNVLFIVIFTGVSLNLSTEKVEDEFSEK